MKITKGLIEQHIHGAFGFDFMNCTKEELLYTSELLFQNGVCSFFPTVMTDNITKIKERLEIIKQAKELQKGNQAKITGVHLEGPFINPEKAGIHDKKYIQPLNIELYKQIDDEIIKIITLAPELDNTGMFIKYLKEKNIKISLGHSLGADLKEVNQVTHLYNAMGVFNHRGKSTAVSALINDEIYTEIIADSMHVSDEVLTLTFKLKPKDKIILISDALPLAHSTKKEHIFAGEKIYNQNGKLVNSEGTIAGSSMLLCDIIKNITDKGLVDFETAIKYASSNIAEYHKIDNNLQIEWNEDNTIKQVKLD